MYVSPFTVVSFFLGFSIFAFEFWLWLTFLYILFNDVFGIRWEADFQISVSIYVFCLYILILYVYTSYIATITKCFYLSADFFYLSACLHACLPVCLSFHLSVCLSFRLSVCLYIDTHLLIQKHTHTYTNQYYYITIILLAYMYVYIYVYIYICTYIDT